MNAPSLAAHDTIRVLRLLRDGQQPDEDDLGDVTGLIDALKGELVVARKAGRYALTPAGLRAAGPRLVLVPPIAPAPSSLPDSPVAVSAPLDTPAPARRRDPVRAAASRRGWERRREADEAVAVNVPADLLPLWERLKAGFSGSPQERLDAFLQYVHDHGGEAVAACDAAGDAELRAVLASAPRRDLAALEAEIESLQAERDALAARVDPTPF